MAFQPNDKAMLEGYIQVARPLEDMFSVKGKVALVPGGASAWASILPTGCSRAARRSSSLPIPQWRKRRQWTCCKSTALGIP